MTGRIRPPVSAFRDLDDDEPTPSEHDGEQPSAPTAPPVIVRFDVEPQLAVRGDELLLSWVVDGADTVLLENLGEQPASGSRAVPATESRRYHLTSSNAAGDATASTGRVQVVEVPPIRTLAVPMPEVRLTLELPAELLGPPPRLARSRVASPDAALPSLPGAGLPAVPRPALRRLETPLEMPNLPPLTVSLPLLADDGDQSHGRSLWQWAKRLWARQDLRSAA